MKWAKRPIEISLSHFFCFFFIFFIVKTLSHDTLTANHNTDETNETNTTKKMKKKNTKIDVHFTQNAGAIVYGIHDGYKILPQLL